MFNKLIQRLFSAFSQNRRQPDYEAFVKLRAKEQDLQHSALSAVSSSTAKPSLEFVDKTQKLDLLFYNYLFGESVDSQKQDPLSDFVCSKVQMQLKDPANVLENLPVLPASVTQVLTLLNKDDFNLDNLLKIVEREPAMAGALIQQANSAQYRQANQQVMNLKQAFMTLGATGVRETILKQFFKQLTPADNLYYKFFGQKIWNHTHSVADICQKLAESQVSPPQNGSAYFVGLFHALGKMIIFQFMVEAFHFVSPDSQPSSEAFKQLIQTYHKQLTLQVAEYWNLPQSVLAALKYEVNADEGDLKLCLAEAINLSKLISLYKARVIDEDEYYNYCRYFRLSDDALDIAEDSI